MENFKIIEVERFMLFDMVNEFLKFNFFRLNVIICLLNEFLLVLKIVLVCFVFELVVGVIDKFLIM